MASLVAWNIAVERADAKVKLASDKDASGSGSNPPDWKIKANKLEKSESTLASSSQWTDPADNIAYTVAIGLKLTVDAPQDPGEVGEFSYAYSATSVITVKATEFVKCIKSSDVNGDIDWDSVPEMSLAQMNRYFDRSASQAADSHSVTVEMYKEIDKSTGAIKDQSWKVAGKETDDEDYDPTPSPVDGITLGFEWTGGQEHPDKVTVQFHSDQVQWNTSEVDPVFEKKNFGGK